MKNRFLKYGIVVLSIIAPVASFYAWQMAYTPNLNTKSGEDFYLLIPSSSATYETVLDSLKKNNIVKDEMAFRFMAKLLKYPHRVKPGRYKISPDAPNYATINALRLGEQAPLRLTFNNVRTPDDLIRKIGNRFEFDSTAFAEAIKSPEVCASYGFKQETVLAMFLPNTYEVYWNTTPEKLMDRMKKEYDTFWNDSRKVKATALNLSPIEVMTLASIVQAETKKTDEQPKVAGAYLNRLRDGEALQADPTVIFGIGDFTIRRLLNYQLQHPSPYNTYIYTGLPPGPINLPEGSAVDAVLNYEKHNYKYFCASPDLNGYHIFAVTFSEHLANARKYQEALNTLGIKK